MEKNDFLLYNEALYHIHACRTMETLRPTLLTQLKLLIPWAYSSLIPIREDPETGQLVHQEPYGSPTSFAQAERDWIVRTDRANSLWLSHAREPTVLRDSEILAGDSRFSLPSYRDIYGKYRIHDSLQMNIVHGGKVLGRLTLYRTEEEGLFTDQDVFYLRAMANHIGLVWHLCTQGRTGDKDDGSRLDQLARARGLTRREKEVLGYIFQEMDNGEILERMGISRNTLLKHLQNLYRKCGVTARWDLLKLRN